MTHFPFGLSLIFVSNELDQSLVNELAKAGVVTYEINARHLLQEQQQVSAKHLFQPTGPRPSSIHALFGAEYDFSRLEPEVWQTAVDQAVNIVEIAANLNIPILVFHASAEPVLPAERALRMERAMEGFRIIGEKAQETGRRIAIEYLPRTCLGNTTEELLALVSRLGDETFGVCLDVNHLMDRYAELPQIVRNLGKHLIATHISDCDAADEKHWLPGQGVLNWPGFMQALSDIKYQGPFTYECDVEGNNLAEKLTKMQSNYRWLNGLIP